MAQQDDPVHDRIYAARLTPYRSMTPMAFKRFMVGFACFNLVASLPFFILGAWPVVGFLGIDVLALYVAFKINFRAAGAYETLEVTPLELIFVKVSARGRREVWRFNPSWVRLEQQTHEEFGAEKLALAGQGESVEIGAFLGPEQKAALARELGLAIGRARRGARFA
jgi:uncharacterized membrane protein